MTHEAAQTRSFQGSSTAAHCTCLEVRVAIRGGTRAQGRAREAGKRGEKVCQGAMVVERTTLARIQSGSKQGGIARPAGLGGGRGKGTAAATHARARRAIQATHPKQRRRGRGAQPRHPHPATPPSEPNLVTENDYAHGGKPSRGFAAAWSTLVPPSTKTA